MDETTQTQDIAGLRLAIEEMRYAMQVVLHNGDALDQKAHLLVGIAGAILTLFIAVQTAANDTARSQWFWAGLILAFAVYLGMLVITLRSVSPTVYQLAIKNDLDALHEHLIDNPERTAMYQLLRGYVSQIAYNESVNQEKARRLRIALYLLPVIIVILTVTNFIP